MPSLPWSRTLPAKATTSRTEYPPGSRQPPGLFSALPPCQGTGRHARERVIGIVSQMAGSMVLSRAVSHVAHDHADEPTEVNRANPGSWAAQKGRPPSVSSVN